MPLSTLRETPHAVPRKTQGQDGFATSFPVGLLHPLQHAGLSRRTPSCPSIAENLRLTTAPTTKSTHRQCRKLIANGKPSASSTARYRAPMVAPSRQKSLVGM